MRHLQSWQWALTKLLDGERLHWHTWGSQTWIKFDSNNNLTRYSKFRGKLCKMMHFTLSKEKVLIEGWAIYEPPPEAVRDEILFREFNLEEL